MIYLDNAANAPVFPEVLDAMLPWLRPDHVGNPGSIHTQGKRAREAINKAREQVAHMIGADPTESCSTSVVNKYLPLNPFSQALLDSVPPDVK